MGANENLKARRKEKGYTQQSIADKLGVSLGAYRNWEQGINYPDKENIFKLTKLLETTSDLKSGCSLGAGGCKSACLILSHKTVQPGHRRVDFEKIHDIVAAI